MLQVPLYDGLLKLLFFLASFYLASFSSPSFSLVVWRHPIDGFPLRSSAFSSFSSPSFLPLHPVLFSPALPGVRVPLSELPLSLPFPPSSSSSPSAFPSSSSVESRARSKSASRSSLSLALASSFSSPPSLSSFLFPSRGRCCFHGSARRTLENQRASSSSSSSSFSSTAPSFAGREETKPPEEFLSATCLRMVKKYLGLRAPDDPREFLFDIRWPDQKPTIELLARKVDMTACFSPDGQAEPVTMLQILPCTLVEFLEFGKAVVAYDCPRRRRRFVTRPVLGRLQKVGASSTGGCELATVTVRPPGEFILGQILDVSSLLGAKHVDVRGLKKAKGFQGIVTRHGFHRGPMSHGSKHHRSPGSIGAGTDPGRVLPGTKMAGRDKAKYATVKNLRVLGINAKQNLLLVRGSVPGWDMKTVLRITWQRWLEEHKEDKAKLLEKERSDRLELIGAPTSGGIKSAKNLSPGSGTKGGGGGKQKKTKTKK